MFYTLAFKKDKNCPTFIDGVIHESFSPGAYDDSMDAGWHDVGPDEELAPLPGKLVLITKDKAMTLTSAQPLRGLLSVSAS